jgi:hypothetical protein
LSRSSDEALAEATAKAGTKSRKLFAMKAFRILRA